MAKVLVEASRHRARLLTKSAMTEMPSRQFSSCVRPDDERGLKLWSPSRNGPQHGITRVCGIVDRQLACLELGEDFSPKDMKNY